MANSPILGWRLPDPSDAPDGPTQMANLSTDAEKYSVMRFATTAAMTAAIPSPIAGMVCIVGSGIMMTQYIYDGALWRHGAIIDSGWLSLTMAGTFTGNNLPAVRVRNGIAHYRGRIGGTFALGAQTIAFPPAVALPAIEALTYTIGMNTDNNAQPISLFVTPAGELKAGPSVAGAGSVGLAALCYSVD